MNESSSRLLADKIRRALEAAGAAVFLASGSLFFSDAKAAPAAPVPVSSASAAGGAAGQNVPGGQALGPADLYSGDKWHDPFVKPSAAAPAGGTGAGAIQAEGPEVFSIHALSLKGVLRAKTGDIAILTSSRGTRYFFREGRLYDSKNKLVRGVSGKVFASQKKVLLETSDQDVQTLILGVEETDQ